MIKKTKTNFKNLEIFRKLENTNSKLGKIKRVNKQLIISRE